MKRKKTKNIASAALMAMRLVICRLAILSGGQANAQDVAGCRHARSKLDSAGHYVAAEQMEGLAWEFRGR